jgi:hypothetical protein
LDGIKSYKKKAKALNSDINTIMQERFSPYLSINSNQNYCVAHTTVIDYLKNIFSNKVFPLNNLFDYDSLLEFLKNETKNEVEIDLIVRHTPQCMLYIAILLFPIEIHLHGLEHNYVKDILNKDGDPKLIKKINILFHKK